MITQETLKQLLHYDPETGVFTWLKKRGKSAVNKEAGHNCFKNTKQYRLIGVETKLYRAHRLAWLYMTGSMPALEIDHIDGNGLNNAWLNLREVDRRENCRNMRLHNHNTSGISGVSWRKQRNKWRAYVMVDNHQINLGHYDDLFEACCARKSAELKYGFHENHGSDRPL